jgi:hypothetical protein
MAPHGLGRIERQRRTTLVMEDGGLVDVLGRRLGRTKNEYPFVPPTFPHFGRDVRQGSLGVDVSPRNRRHPKLE